jgi:hypothetical protein
MAAPKIVGKLTVTVNQANELRDMQSIGKQDPYALLKVGGESFKTKTHEDGGRNPKWEQAYLFNLDGKEEFLHLTVWDYNSVKDELIGRSDVSLMALASSTDAQWFQVIDPDNFKKSVGKVQLTCKFEGTGVPKKEQAQAIVQQQQQQQQQQYAQQYAQQPQVVYVQQPQVVYVQQPQVVYVPAPQPQVVYQPPVQQQVVQQPVVQQYQAPVQQQVVQQPVVQQQQQQKNWNQRDGHAPYIVE